MKHFDSFLAPELKEYMRHRQALGYQDRNLRSFLRRFDHYVKEHAVDWDCFNPLFFLELRKKLKDDANTINGIIYAVRGFFQFLTHKGDYDYNPLQDIPPVLVNQYIPLKK